MLKWSKSLSHVSCTLNQSHTGFGDLSNHIHFVKLIACPQLCRKSTIPPKPEKPKKFEFLNHAMHRELCEKHRDAPWLKQKELVSWFFQKYEVRISLAIISTTLAKSDFILVENEVSSSRLSTIKRQRMVTYPLMEMALHQWFLTQQVHVNILGDLIKSKSKLILKQLYLSAEKFEFANGWLDRFKTQFGIKSFRRFGESGSVDMVVVEDARPILRQLLD